MLHVIYYFHDLVKLMKIMHLDRQDYRRTRAAVTTRSRHERDQHSVSAFIERFAVALTEAGFLRMPARVFAGLLATDSGRLTAADLANLLQVSPAAVSGAVRYLAQVNLASREREPGSRRDYYRVQDDVWYEAIARREQVLARWERSLREGIEVLGRESAAGARMAETLAFFEFLQKELPSLLKKWREHKIKLGLRPWASPGGVEEKLRSSQSRSMKRPRRRQRIEA
jgi:DNA-binding transcriptional regulator GbsR (MarR family)